MRENVARTLQNGGRRVATRLRLWLLASSALPIAPGALAAIPLV